MGLSSQQRGRIFERFIKQILLNSGFTVVNPDNKIIYNSASGLMLHGLAQPHNTDVLVAPPFQIPFFYPTRLIIECKCYKTSIDLPVIRNALGLREDINGFDIVTQDILDKRRNYRRRGLAVSDVDRYLYQVAVASLSGFTKPAQEFAIVHHIPLINIERMPFCQQIRDVLLYDDYDFGRDEEQLEGVVDDSNGAVDIQWQRLQGALESVLKKFCVAILVNGDILFLYTDSGEKWFFNIDEIELHWAEHKRLWRIIPRGDHNISQETWFELPDILFYQWTEMKFSRTEAIDMKEQYFHDIYVMGKDLDNKTRLQILSLSEEFIREARERLQQTQRNSD